MPGVDQLFKLTRLEPENIDYIAYTNGPGSFTGLRIGASTALGLAKALKIQAIPVPSLDALAYNALEMGSESWLIPLLDARRGQVYAAVYKRHEGGYITKKSEYMAMSVEDFMEYLLHEHLEGYSREDSILFLGDGADENLHEIRKKIPTARFAPANNNRLRAASVGMYAIQKIHQGHEFSNKVDIIYVRAPQAVREA